MFRIPRLRFGVKFLLVSVAVVSVWLAYQTRWLKERREALAWIQQHESGEWSSISAADVIVIDASGVPQPDQARPVPLAVRLFGAPRIHIINLDKAKLSAADMPLLDQLQTLFPEAEGVYVDDPEFTHCWPPEDREGFFAGEEPVQP